MAQLENTTMVYEEETSNNYKDMIKIQQKKDRIKKKKAKKRAEKTEHVDLGEQIMALDKEDPDFEKKVIQLYEKQHLRAEEMQKSDIRVLENLRKQAEQPSMKTQVKVERPSGNEASEIDRDVRKMENQ